MTPMQRNLLVLVIALVIGAVFVVPHFTGT